MRRDVLYLRQDVQLEIISKKQTQVDLSCSLTTLIVLLFVKYDTTPDVRKWTAGEDKQVIFGKCFIKNDNNLNDFTSW